MLQTAWLSPPVALSAYFLKGGVPEWDLKDIYIGMMQFMVLQVIGVGLLLLFPQIALWLPSAISTEPPPEAALPQRGAAARRRRSLIASPRPCSGMGMTAITGRPLASSSCSMRNRLAAASVRSPVAERLRTGPE